MGGVGKTELATQYARRHENDYPGGIYWINARSANIAAQIIQFALNLGLQVPQKDFDDKPLGILEQVKWCWQNWQSSEDLVLVVFDDVVNLDGFAEILPTDSRFRVLITTRLRNLDINIEEISLDVLSAEEALELLKKIVAEKKVNKELATAQELCKWLGYLPLGIELVGRYLVKKPPHWTLKKMLEQLKQQRLHQEAMNPQQKSLSTAQLGVLAAFEISWVELSPQTQELAGLLSLFAADIFVWEWVEYMTQLLNWDDSDVELGIEQLYQRHLVQCLEEESEYYYQIHPLIREFLQVKLQASPQINELKQAFTGSFIKISQTIPKSPTLQFINSVKNAIPHLTEVAENHLNQLSHTNLFWVLYSLGNFYKGQGLYVLAEPWYQQCVSELKSRLGENHPSTASSLNNLALLYNSMGRYEEAEPIYKQALELKKQLLGENHPSTASSLNNLANLYSDMGRYEEAEPIYKQAVEIAERVLGESHPHTVMYRNNFEDFRKKQGESEG